MAEFFTPPPQNQQPIVLPSASQLAAPQLQYQATMAGIQAQQQSDAQRINAQLAMANQDAQLKQQQMLQESKQNIMGNALQQQALDVAKQRLNMDSMSSKVDTAIKAGTFDLAKEEFKNKLTQQQQQTAINQQVQQAYLSGDIQKAVGTLMGVNPSAAMAMQKSIYDTGIARANMTKAYREEVPSMLKDVANSKNPEAVFQQKRPGLIAAGLNPPEHNDPQWVQSTLAGMNPELQKTIATTSYSQIQQNTKDIPGLQQQIAALNQYKDLGKQLAAMGLAGRGSKGELMRELAEKGNLEGNHILEQMDTLRKQLVLTKVQGIPGNKSEKILEFIAKSIPGTEIEPDSFEPLIDNQIKAVQFALQEKQMYNQYINQGGDPAHFDTYMQGTDLYKNIQAVAEDTKAIAAAATTVVPDKFHNRFAGKQ